MGRRLVRHLTVTGTNNGDIDIAPGDPNYEDRGGGDARVRRQARLGAAASCTTAAGTSRCAWCIRMARRKTVLRVPNYRFDWQVGYELAEPLDLPKGTRLETARTYDNSAANRFNPDPTARVTFGLQSNDEMHVAFMGVLVDRQGRSDEDLRAAAAPGACRAHTVEHCSPQTNTEIFRSKRFLLCALCDR